MQGFPFWVNAIDALPVSLTQKSTCLHIRDIFSCNINDEEEVWSDVLLANYMIDFNWLLETVPELTQIRNKLVILSGEKGHATVSVEKIYNKNVNSTAKSKILSSSSSSEAMELSTVYEECIKRKSPSELRNNEILKVARQHHLGVEKITVIEPPLPFPYGTHHTKMALCVNNRGLRVAIFTANFVHDDWANKSQGIYIQDFPWCTASTHSKLKTSKITYQEKRSADFAFILSRYLHDCGVIIEAAPQFLSNSPMQFNLCCNFNCKKDQWFGIFANELVNLFDFTNAAVWLVPSVPGSHWGQKFYCYGINRLSKVLEHLAEFQFSEYHKLLQSCSSEEKEIVSESIRLSWQYSSQGVLNDTFLHRLVKLMSTDIDILEMLEKTHIESSSSTITTSHATVQVVYPTENEVRESLEGWRGGLSLPVRMKTFHPFVNERLHRWGSSLWDTCKENKECAHKITEPSIAHYRKFALPHIKTYASIDNRKQKLRWFLLTSANLSQAAWGSVNKTSYNNKKLSVVNSRWKDEFTSKKNTLEKRKRGRGDDEVCYQNSKIFIRSYELGVLFDFTSHLTQNECFSVTPTHRIALPTIENCNDLFKISLIENIMLNQRQCYNSYACEPVIFLPYDIINSVPYSNNSEHKENRNQSSSQDNRKRNKEEIGIMLDKCELEVDFQDVPWAIDALHIGKDSLGELVETAMEEYSHYGELCLTANLRTSFPTLPNVYTSYIMCIPRNHITNEQNCPIVSKRTESNANLHNDFCPSKDAFDLCRINNTEIIDVDAVSDTDNIVVISNNSNSNNYIEEKKNQYSD